MSSPSVAKIADFLLFLRRIKGLSVFAVKDFQSMLTSVLKYRLPELSDHFLLRDLIRSFKLECPVCSPCPPTWDLCRVVDYLRGPVARLRVRYFFAFLSHRELVSSRLCCVQLRFVVRTFRCPTCPSLWPKQSLNGIRFLVLF